MSLYPLFDRVLVKRRETEEVSQGGLYIPPAHQEKPQEGIVVRIGVGRILDNGTQLGSSVSPGDVIVFGKFAGVEVSEPDADLVLREDEIIGVRRQEEAVEATPV